MRRSRHATILRRRAWSGFDHLPGPHAPFVRRGLTLGGNHGRSNPRDRFTSRRRDRGGARALRDRGTARQACASGRGADCWRDPHRTTGPRPGRHDEHRTLLQCGSRLRRRSSGLESSRLWCSPPPLSRSARVKRHEDEQCVGLQGTSAGQARLRWPYLVEDSRRTGNRSPAASCTSFKPSDY